MYELNLVFKKMQVKEDFSTSSDIASGENRERNRTLFSIFLYNRKG
jgi:hypothetical protein